MFQNLQRVLGIAGLVWAAFLLPRTGFLLWIGANVLYALLAFAAAGMNVEGHRHFGLALATGALLLFVAVNGGIGYMACTTGGACAPILAVIAAIAPAQLVIIIASARTREAR